MPANRPDLTAFGRQALELRSGAPRYNFLGGKRDSEDETPWVVAAREAHEETGGLLSASARRRRSGHTIGIPWAYHMVVHTSRALQALQALRHGPLLPGAAHRACRACSATG